jgi:hypothetical protein
MLLMLSLVSVAAPELPCATPSTWAAIVDPEPALPPPPDGLGLRDAYGVPNSRTSEHFVLRWGNARRVDSAALDALLLAFEDAWAVEIEEMGHTRPYGSGEYYFNVYVGDSGSGAPEGHGAAGYYTADVEGWPMIVVGVNTLDSRDYADITAVHEFYHAIQGATRRYDYDFSGPSAWFWEATATWASSVVYEENPGYASFLAGYAFLPHKRLNFFDYPDSGQLQEYYQYGAFIFPLHVSDRLGSWQAVRDTWEDPGDDPDPLAVLRDKVAEQGGDMDALWLDHIARNTTWDYPQGGFFRAAIADWSAFPESRNQVAATLPALGMQGFVDGPSSLPLERYGSHTLEMRVPQDGRYTFTLQGDALGSLGGTARWGATAVVVRSGADPEYRPVPFDGPRGELVMDDLDGASRVYVALGAWTEDSGARWGVETYDYAYLMSFEPAEAPEPDPDLESPRACACASTGPAAGWLLVPLVLVAVRRRDRSRG